MNSEQHGKRGKRGKMELLDTKNRPEEPGSKIDFEHPGNRGKRGKTKLLDTKPPAFPAFPCSLRSLRHWTQEDNVCSDSSCFRLWTHGCRTFINCTAIRNTEFASRAAAFRAAAHRKRGILENLTVVPSALFPQVPFVASLYNRYASLVPWPLDCSRDRRAWSQFKIERVLSVPRTNNERLTGLKRKRRNDHGPFSQNFPRNSTNERKRAE